MNQQTIEQYGDELYQAFVSRRVIAPLLSREPQIRIEDAYRIQERFIARRLAAGETIVGKKIGATSKPVQDFLGVYQPDFGMLTSGMVFADGDTLDLDAYLAQAAEYDVGGSAWDNVIKALNTALREHPFHTVRAGELNRWQQSGAYATIVSGDYIRRGSEAERPLRDDLRDAKDYYADKAKAAAETVGDVITRAADAFRDAFKTAANAASMGDDMPPPPVSPSPPPAEPPTAV